jgi:hypothetical protein
VILIGIHIPETRMMLRSSEISEFAARHSGLDPESNALSICGYRTLRSEEILKGNTKNNNL